MMDKRILRDLEKMVEDMIYILKLHKEKKYIRECLYDEKISEEFIKYLRDIAEKLPNDFLKDDLKNTLNYISKLKNKKEYFEENERLRENMKEISKFLNRYMEDNDLSLPYLDFLYNINKDYYRHYISKMQSWITSKCSGNYINMDINSKSGKDSKFLKRSYIKSIHIEKLIIECMLWS